MGGDKKIELKPYCSTELGSLYKGDCLEVMDYLISQDIKFDAIITDPPYAVTNFSWDQIIPFDEMWKRLLSLIKDDGAIVLFGNEPFSSSLRKSCEKLYRYDWKWIKTQVTGFVNAKYQPLRCYEDIMIFSKAGAISNCLKNMCYYPQGLIPVHLKSRGKPQVLNDKSWNFNKSKEYVKEYENYPRNVLQFARETHLFHPTQKPCNLMEYLILTYTKKDELILDFTAGSGSTLIASELLNRRWIGIEITDKYCEVIKRRIENGLQLKIDFENDLSKEED